jgi:hypothetical protein
MFYPNFLLIGQVFGGGIITFGPGMTQTQDIAITIIDDVVVEEDESLLTSLSSQDSNVDVVNSTSLLVITDDDSEHACGHIS